MERRFSRDNNDLPWNHLIPLLDLQAGRQIVHFLQLPGPECPKSPELS